MVIYIIPGFVGVPHGQAPIKYATSYLAHIVINLGRMYSLTFTFNFLVALYICMHARKACLICAIRKILAQVCF